MAQTMKIRKGDTVAGHQRQGPRQARAASSRRCPKHGRVLVENVNIDQAAPAPAPDPELEPHGRPADHPGRRSSRSRRRCRSSNVMVVCPTCKQPTRVGTRDEDGQGQDVRVRVCKNADCGQEIDKSWRRTETYTPRFKERYETRSGRR